MSNPGEDASTGAQGSTGSTPVTDGNASQSSSITPRPKTSNTDIMVRFQEHPFTQFDEAIFLDLLEHSLSLSIFEKRRVIDAIPTLSQFQIDELTKVFEEERVEFRKLMEKEGDIIKGLLIKAQNEWEELKDIYKEEERAFLQSQKDTQKAEAIRKNLGLN